MTEGPLLWYLNRSTGFVLLALLTITTVLGVLSTGGKAGKRVPSFVTQAVHRNVALLSVSLLIAHVATAVADTFVDIRWWQAIVPWIGSTYLPLWLGLGTLALDLMLVVALTSLVRSRLSHAWWRGLHLLSYAAWAVSVAHGIGIGTDVRGGEMWGYGLIGGSILAVLAAVGLRLGRAAADRRLPEVVS